MFFVIPAMAMLLLGQYLSGTFTNKICNSIRMWDVCYSARTTWKYSTGPLQYIPASSTRRQNLYTSTIYTHIKFIYMHTSKRTKISGEKHLYIPCTQQRTKTKKSKTFIRTHTHTHSVFPTTSGKSIRVFW